MKYAKTTDLGNGFFRIVPYKNFTLYHKVTGTIGSFDQFLSALSTAMGGTWSKNWSEQNNRLDFSFESTQTEP